MTDSNNYYPQNNPYPVPPQNSMKSEKNTRKIIIIVIAVVLAVIAAAAAVFCVFYFSPKPSEKIPELISEGKYSEAADLYKKKYERGESDRELTNALKKGLKEFPDAYMEGEIESEDAKEYLKTLSSMRIKKLEDDINYAKEQMKYIDGENEKIAECEKAFKDEDYITFFDTFEEIDFEESPEYEKLGKKAEEAKKLFREQTVEKAKEAADDGDFSEAEDIIRSAAEYLPDDDTLDDLYGEIRTNEETSEEPETTAPVILDAQTLEGNILPASNADASRTFDADRVIDGQAETCWCVSVSDSSPVGASLKINFTETADLNGINIINGNLFQPEDNIYLSNGQLKSFTLTFSDGTSQSFTIDKNENAAKLPQNIKLNEPVKTDYIILTVNNYYPGQKYPGNVCIGEISVF